MDMDFRPMSTEEVEQRTEMLNDIPRLLLIPEYLSGEEELESTVIKYNELRVHDYPEDLEEIKFLYTKFKNLKNKLDIDYIEEHKEEKNKNLDEQEDNADDYFEEIEEIVKTEEETLEEELQNTVDFSEDLDISLDMIEDEPTSEIKMVSNNGEDLELSNQFENSIIEEEPASKEISFKKDEDLSLEERINLALYGTTDFDELKRNIDEEEALLNIKL